MFVQYSFYQVLTFYFVNYLNKTNKLTSKLVTYFFIQNNITKIIKSNTQNKTKKNKQIKYKCLYD